MIVFVAFSTLVVLSLLHPQVRLRLLSRKRDDWILDAISLVVQGVLIPTLEIVLVIGILHYLSPSWHRAIDMPPATAFFLNFVVVDYLYYWNHRWLHTKRMWLIHATHHTPEHMDVLITSRNTLWAPILIVYLWLNGFFIFVLSDPTYFVLGASMTAALDLWRHTSFGPAAGSRLHRLLALILITPVEHAWHHSTARAHGNFGANFSLWDRLHGTFFQANELPSRFGIPLPLSPMEKLLFPLPPFRLQKGE